MLMTKLDLVVSQDKMKVKNYTILKENSVNGLISFKIY